MLAELFFWLFPAQCGGCDRLGTGVCEACLPRAATRDFALEDMRVRALGPYDGALRTAILALKSGRRDVAQSFGEAIARHVRSGDVLVPVPTTGARRRERGFDGCALMAQVAAAVAGCAVVPGLALTRGDRQRGRDRAARLVARGRFEWRGGPLNGTRVRLLDDVVTTGATLRDCAAAVRAAGGVVEDALVIANA